MIAKNAMTPNDVAESFDVSRQAISKHMKILTECGILMLKKQGRKNFYSLQPNRLEEINRWMEQFKQMWEQKFNQLDEILKQP